MRATKIEYQKIVSESKRLITELQKYKNIEDEKYKMDRMNRMKTKEIRRRDQFKKSRERKKKRKNVYSSSGDEYHKIKKFVQC